MSLADLERATASAAAIMAKVTPDQLDASTPCASWKVRDIINHLVGGTYFFTTVAQTGAPPKDEGEAPDFAAGDFNAAYAEGCAKMLEAFGAEGFMERNVDFGFMQVPGIAAFNIAMTDTFTHAWDIARAIGQSTDLEPDLATKLLANAKISIPDTFRGEEGKSAFGPIIDVSESAPPADQLAGFLGRQV